MELKEFIETTLCEIVLGVKAAQDKSNPLGAVVNAKVDYPLDSNYPQTHLPQEVQFDVALTSASEGKEKGGIGVCFGPFATGGQLESGTATTSQTRVKFSVQVLYPLPSGDTP